MASSYFPTVDLFDFFRLSLAWVVTIYASILTLQSMWGWYVWLAGTDQYISLVRRYVIVHGLRLRVRAFWGDVVICIFLTVVCLILWHAHSRVDQLKVALDRLRQSESQPRTLNETTHPRSQPLFQKKSTESR